MFFPLRFGFLVWMSGLVLGAHTRNFYLQLSDEWIRAGRPHPHLSRNDSQVTCPTSRFVLCVHICTFLASHQQKKPRKKSLWAVITPGQQSEPVSPIELTTPNKCCGVCAARAASERPLRAAVRAALERASWSDNWKSSSGSSLDSESYTTGGGSTMTGSSSTRPPRCTWLMNTAKSFPTSKSRSVTIFFWIPLERVWHMVHIFIIPGDPKRVFPVQE